MGMNKYLMKENKKDGGNHVMWAGPRASLQSSSETFPNHKHAQNMHEHMIIHTHERTQEPYSSP